MKTQACWRGSATLQLDLSRTRLQGLLVIAGVGVLRALTDPRAEEVEDVRDSATRETDEGEQGTGPLVVQAVVHLDREQHDTGTPETTDAGLGGEGGGCLVLVGIDEVVVGGVVEEDEAETNGETAKCGTSPVETRVRGPGEDEETDGDEPAGDHHGVQSGFGRGFSIVLGNLLQVVFVDDGRAGSRS